MGVPFEFHAIAEKWEAITPAHLLLRDDEVLAVNSMFRFRHLLDESVTAASPRNLVLSRIRSLNPKVFSYTQSYLEILQIKHYRRFYIPLTCNYFVVIRFMLCFMRLPFCFPKLESGRNMIDPFMDSR